MESACAEAGARSGDYIADMTERETDAFDAKGVYSFLTELGTFRIVARNDTGVALWLDDTWLGTHASAEDAAADVWAGKTGHVRWDRTHARQTAPRHLSDWQRVE